MAWFLLMCFQHLEWMQLIHEFSTETFDWWILRNPYELGHLFCPKSCEFKNQKLCWSLWYSSFDFEIGNTVLNLLDWFNDEFIHAPLIPIYLMRIRFQVVTILDTVVCSGTLLWCSLWPATMKLLFQALYLSNFNLSPTQYTCLFKTSLSVLCARTIQVWFDCKGGLLFQLKNLIRSSMVY